MFMKRNTAINFLENVYLGDESSEKPNKTFPNS